MLDLEFTPQGIDTVARTATADPRDPAFYQDPYGFYAALHAAAPAFMWKNYGHWCFAGFKEDLLTHMIVTEQNGEKLTDDEVISTAICCSTPATRRRCTPPETA